MSDRMDQLMRLAAKKDVTPPKGLEERTMRKIEQKSEEKKRVKPAIVFRSAAVLLLLAVVCLAAGSMFVNYRSLTKDYSNDSQSNKETEEKAQEFRMEIDRVEEEQDLGELSPYTKIKITPQTALSDGFSTYVVFKVEGINGFVIKDDIVLDEEYCGISLHCTEGEDFDSCEDCYISGRQENALYYTAARWGTTVSLGKELVIDIAATNLICAEVDESGHAQTSDDTPVIDPGAYRAKIYCKVFGKPNIRKLMRNSELPYDMQISPLGILFRDMEEYDKEKLLNVGNISVILKDGTQIPVTLQNMNIDIDGILDLDTATGSVSTFDTVISDPIEIRYLVFDRAKYDLDKIEKEQRQK